MTTTLSPSLRKAALLIRSLDADSAAVLLAQLSREEAKAVRQAIRELGEIDPLEQEELRTVLGSRGSAARHSDNQAGVEVAFSTDLADTLERCGESSPPAMKVPAPALPAAALTDQAVDNRPFAWLEGGDLPSLAVMLEREHLSTVAVVLSHLPADRASEVLAALPPGRRAAAIERLADLGESDRASLEVIERELAEWIAAQKAERQRRADRLRSIQAILRHSSPATCESVLAEIAAHDELLAGEIGKIRSTNNTPDIPAIRTRTGGQQAASLTQPVASPKATRPPKAATRPPRPVVPRLPPPPAYSFDFNRLVELDDRQLAELFRHCSGERVVLALAGASEQVMQHVERLLPKSIVKELQRRMHTLTSVRLSDFTAAQQELAAIAGRLFGETLAKS